MMRCARFGTRWALTPDTQAPVPEPAAPAKGEPLRTLIARIFDPITLALSAAAVVLASFGVVVAAGDGAGEKPWAFGLMIGSILLPTAWSVLQALWKPDPERPAPLAALQRTLLVPLLVAPAEPSPL